MSDALNRERDLFRLALEKPPAERAAFLRAQCDTPDLLARIELLLRAHEDAERRVTQHFVKIDDGGLSASALEGRELGRFRIVRLIAEGGMGVVYEAEQHQPRRRVALKLIRPGLATPELMARFDYEAQVLGHLQHPSIARIFEAGQTIVAGQAQPFFAMEFIEGSPVTQFVREQDLSVRDRLELMIEIALGVDYAHRQGVIHRDLKPGNLLIDPEGRPHILDFGLARMTDVDGDSASLRTQAGELVGTLPYMSPEQVSGDPSAIDHRTDVYALGVLAYELLTGRLPLDLGNRSLPDLAQRICHERPVPISDFQRSWRGDLETILNTALAKEKERRFSSAEAFASDLKRYLQHQPIQARPTTRYYLLRKFAQRNKVLVTSIFLTSFLALPMTTYGLVRASQERDQARLALAKAEAAERRAHLDRAQAIEAETEAEADRQRAVAAEAKAEEDRQRALAAEAEAREEQRRALAAEESARSALVEAETVIEFLERMLSAARPGEGNGEASLREVVDYAARDILEREDLPPSVAVRIHQTLGETYYLLSAFDASEQQYVKVQQRLESEQGPYTEAALSARMGRLQSRVGGHPSTDAFQLLNGLQEDIKQYLGAEHALSSRVLLLRASLERRLGMSEDALEHARKAADRLEQTLGPDDPISLSAQNTLAAFLMDRGQPAEALALFEKLAERQQRILGAEHPRTLIVQQHRAQCYYWLGQLQKSIEAMEQVLEDFRRVYGPESLGTQVVQNNLGVMYTFARRFEDANRLLDECYAIRSQKLGLENEDTLQTACNLAGVLEQTGQLEKAEAIYVEVLPTLETVLGAGAGLTLIAKHNYGRILMQLDQPAAARTHLELAALGAASAYSEHHLFTGVSRKSFAACLVELEDSRAEQTLLEAHELLTVSDRGKMELTDCVQKLIRFYTDRGDEAEAAKWRARLAENGMPSKSPDDGK